MIGSVDVRDALLGVIPLVSDLRNNLDEVVDEVDANTFYMGWTIPGTSKSVAQWRIRKISVSGTITTMRWANGSSAFVHTWNNRSTYTYVV